MGSAIPLNERLVLTVDFEAANGGNVSDSRRQHLVIVCFARELRRTEAERSAPYDNYPVL